MKKYLIDYILVMLAVFYLFHLPSARSQSNAKVENINFYAEGSKLIITYDIVKAKTGETFDIWIKIVTSSGKEISPITFSGDAESGITGGQGKKIIWDVQADNVVLDEEFSVVVFARPLKKAEEPEKVKNPVSSGSLGPRDVFMPDKVSFVWLGIDYSHLRIKCETDPDIIKNQYFQAWNKLILDEPDKYRVKKMLRLDDLKIDIETITKHNAETNTAVMRAEYAPDYSLSDIASFVKSYNSQSKTGIGIVFIAEFIDKPKKEGVFHVVAIDMTNNEVLISERMHGEPGGAGFRNYWAGSVYEIILQFEKKYKELKGKYSK
jgi:hypothetical protein